MQEQKSASIEKSMKELNTLLVRQTAELALKNRELEIEGALEKVRARAMKMQKSDELAETAFVLFQQFKELGEAPDQITIGIVREEVELIEFWVTIDGRQVEHKVEASVKESAVMNKMFAAWKENKKSLVIDLTGKPLRDYLSYRAKISGNIDNRATIAYSDKRRVIHCAFFSKGLISFSSTEPKPIETVGLLERFSGVFDQTYVRFLDLQKAEAQAREAQIETALERVRSRSMAMHKSDELREVIKVIYEQLVQLNFEISNAGFLMDYRKNDDYNLWLADALVEYPTKQHIPYFDHPFNDDYLEQKSKGSELFTGIYSFEEKNAWLENVLKYLPGIPEEAKNS